MHTTIRALLGAGLVVAMFGVAVAKLPPAPPQTEEQKAAKAAQDKAKADAEKATLEKAEDKAVANYHANMKAKGQPAGAPMAAASDASGQSKSLPSQPEKASNAHSPPKK